MNFMISIAGWFLWNWGEFTITKEEADNDNDPNTVVTLKDFKNKKYPTWIGSLVCVPVVLWIISKQINLDLLAPIVFFDGEGKSGGFGAHDIYLLGAGAAWEAFIFIGRWVRSFFKKKAAKLNG